MIEIILNFTLSFPACQAAIGFDEGMPAGNAVATAGRCILIFDFWII